MTVHLRMSPRVLLKVLKHASAPEGITLRPVRKWGKVEFDTEIEVAEFVRLNKILGRVTKHYDLQASSRCFHGDQIDVPISNEIRRIEFDAKRDAP